MEERIAIITGGLRGLGQAMAFGLAGAGHNVVAVGHIEADIAAIEAEMAGVKPAGRILPLVADPPTRRLRPRRRDDVVAARQRAHPRQQCGPDLHGDRPGPLPAERAAEILAGAGRHRPRRHRNQLHRRRPIGPARRADDGRAGLGPHRQCDDQARHDEPPAYLALRRLEGGPSKWPPKCGPRRSRARASRSTSSIPAPAPTRQAWPRRCAQ